MRNLTSEWAAGLFEGEGCVSIFRDKKNLQVVSISMNSTDLDVIENMKRVSGGRINGPYSYKTKPHCKIWWCWTVTGVQAYDFLLAIRPYMCSRRRLKIDEALEILIKRKGICESLN